MNQIPISNRFDPLSSLNPEERDDSVNTVAPSNSSNSASKKIKPPPPIILKAQPLKEKYKNFIDHLKTHVKNGFKIKNGKEKTTIFIQKETDWINYKQILKEQNVEFYTFTNKNEKNHAFVLKGLQHEEDTKTIEDQLKEQNIPIRQVHRMRTKYSPMYMVITNNSITLNKIKQIKSISHVIVTWEKVINKKKTIQCHRCQEWSHGTANCNSGPKCLKCADDHWTRDCKQSNETTPKCANCHGAHLANDEKCKVYQDRINQILTKNNKSGNNKKNTITSKDEINFPAFKVNTPPTRIPWATQIDNPARVPDTRPLRIMR